MPERSALYYPHTELQSAALLRTSLLLWDKVDFIVPDPHYRPEYYERPLFARAHELIGCAHYPSDDEKKEAHELILDFATRQLPEPLFYRDREPNHRDYQIFPQKLLPETWQVLQEAQLAGTKKTNLGYSLDEMASLSVMSILADCCAGKSLRRITDRGRAYGSLIGLLADKTSPAGKALDETHERLVPISLKVINIDDLELERLIDFREREEKSSAGYQIRELRHRYIDALGGVAKQLSEATSLADHKEIERQFEQDMKDDMAALREELKLSKKESFLSKEVLTVSVVSAAAAAYFTGHHVVELGKELNNLVTWTGGTVTLGGAYLVGSKFQAKRHEILKKHPMAYLYEYS